MKVLLVGFNQFGSLSVNPSQAIVQQLAERRLTEGVTLITEVLPTEFVTAESRIRKSIQNLRPNLVIILGVACGANCIRLERVALNIDHSETPDNRGDAPRDRIIEPTGPVAYWSTLPLQRLMDMFTKLEIPVEISSHAGTYVCNHVFYAARYEIEKLNLTAQCGLIHVPIMLEQVEANGAAFVLPQAVMAEAVKSCISSLYQEFWSRSSGLTAVS